MKLLPFKISALLLVASAPFSSGIITAIFPILTEYYGVSAQKSSLLVSLFLFGYLSGQIFYGFLSKYKGYKYSLLIGFSILLSGDILQVCFIQGVDFSLFCLARFISAFGASSGLVCIFGIVNEIFAEEKENKKFLSLLFISLTLFAYFSILIGGIINFSSNWRFIFYFAVLISLIKIVLVSRYIPSTKKTNISTTDLRFIPILKTYTQAFRHQKLLSSSLLIAFTTTATYTYASMVPTISANIFQLSPLTFSVVSLLNLLGLIIGGIINIKLNQRFSVLNVLLIGIIISTISVISLSCQYTFVKPSWTSFAIFFITTGILNLGLGIIYPAASFLAINSMGCHSTSSSIMNFYKIGVPTLILLVLSKLNDITLDSYLFILLMYCTFLPFLYYLVYKDNEAFINAL